MTAVTTLINAITGLAWPVIVGLVIWRLFPSIKQIVESRGFTVKVGNAELSVQQVSEKLLETTASLQGKLATVSTAAERSRSELVAEVTAERQLHKVLWVDDHLENIVYEVAQLERLGLQIIQVTTTSAGMAAWSDAEPPYDAVISDLGRGEGRHENPDAGLDLIRQIRAQDSAVPVFIYGSSRALDRRAEIEAAGASGVTASPSELFALLRSVGSFPRGD